MIKIVATVTGCVQVGIDEFRDKHASRVFNGDKTLQDLIDWAAATKGDKNTDICDIKLSVYSGES